MQLNTTRLVIAIAIVAVLGLLAIGIGEASVLGLSAGGIDDGMATPVNTRLQ